MVFFSFVRLLLECGADIDAQDDDGWTPLHAAAHWGQKEACQLLAEKLADMEAKNYVVRLELFTCTSVFVYI